MGVSDEWPDEDVTDATIDDLSEREMDDLYETGVEMYRQVSKGNAPEPLLGDFEEFLAVVNNSRGE